GTVHMNAIRKKPSWRAVVLPSSDTAHSPVAVSEDRCSTCSGVKQMSDDHPQRIKLSKHGPRRALARFAYFVGVGDQAWAYADPDEVDKAPHDAHAVQLDPSLIVAETNPATGERYFAYRGPPVRFGHRV